MILPTGLRSWNERIAHNRGEDTRRTPSGPPCDGRDGTVTSSLRSGRRSVVFTPLNAAPSIWCHRDTSSGRTPRRGVAPLEHSQQAYAQGRQIVLVDVAARTRRVVAKGAHFGEATWWPGGRLAYTCPSRRHAFRWCSVATGGSHKTTLHINGGDVQWSPASGQVAYLRSVRRRGLPHLQVWTSAPSGARARLLFTQRGVCCGGIGGFLFWSADGRQLIVTGNGAQIINAATGQVRQLHSWMASSLTAWRP
jgi:hypothetical protein